MVRFRRWAPAWALALLLLGSVGCSQDGDGAVADPRQAPDFTLTAMDGTPVRLSDHLGKVVMLTFWATWCTPCRLAMPHESEFQTRYATQGFTVLGLSLDKTPQEVEAFLKREPVNYPIALLDDETRAAFGGVPTIPLTLLIDRKGRIRQKKIGFSLDQLPNIERAIEALLSEGAPIPYGS